MGWARGHHNGRQVGYAVAAKCDWPGCDAQINRGLAYACGGMHGEDEASCEGYFCEQHRRGTRRLPSPEKPEGYRYVTVCNDCGKPPSKRRRKALAFGPGVPEQVLQIIDDICELPDYTSPEDQPDLLMCTVDELSTILNRVLMGRE